jgi:hypothetical protein
VRRRPTAAGGRRPPAARPGPPTPARPGDATARTRRAGRGRRPARPPR